MSEIKHAVQRTVSVVSVLTVVACVGWVLYSGYITLVKPHFNPTPTTRQQADEIINYETPIRVGFGGCSHVQIVRPQKNETRRMP